MRSRAKRGRGGCRACRMAFSSRGTGSRRGRRGKEPLVRLYALALARLNGYERVEGLVGGVEGVTSQE